MVRLMRPVEPLRPDTTIAEAAQAIVAADHGLPVVDGDNRLVGYLGQTGLLAAVAPGYLRDLHASGVFTHDLSALRRRARTAASARVGDHMASEPRYVDTDDSETHAAAQFLHTDQHVLPVVDGAMRVVGVLRLSDLVADLTRDTAPPAS